MSAVAGADFAVESSKIHPRRTPPPPRPLPARPRRRTSRFYAKGLQTRVAANVDGIRRTLNYAIDGVKLTLTTNEARRETRQARHHAWPNRIDVDGTYLHPR